jgi:pimeloyl-ACP methyl ester carboxylesterase
MRLSSEELDNLAYWSSPEKMSEQPERAAYEQVINTLSAFVYNKNQLPLLKASINRSTYNLKIAQMVWNDLLKIDYDITRQAKKFKNRCLIIAGRQDALSQRVIEQTANRFSNSELFWLDDCAHILWVDQPDKLYEIVGKFLKIG